MEKQTQFQCYLMDFKGVKHPVCHTFFGHVYQIGSATLAKYSKEVESNPIQHLIPVQCGLYNCYKPWEKGVDYLEMAKWIKNQPTQFSHYTKNINRLSKRNFVGITNMVQLYTRDTTSTCDQRHINKLPVMKKVSAELEKKTG